MSLALYYDLMSQPSRALYILLKTIKCNFEPRPVNLRKGKFCVFYFKVTTEETANPIVKKNMRLL